MTQLDVLVFGAGAIGTYIGGSLAARGHRLTFIEQPQAAEIVQQRGLHLDLAVAQSKGIPFLDESPIIHLPPSSFNCVTSLEQALTSGPFDVAIFALKSYDTQAALEGLWSYTERLPPFLCLQNGVENEARLAAVLAVKDTPRLIPLCHPISITGLDVNFELESERIRAIVTVTSFGKTGVEMEALAGVSVALLNIWDMVKYLEKDETGNYPETEIDEIKVLEKRKE